MKKIFCQKLIYIQSFQLAILQKKLYLEEYVRKVARHIFLTETLSRTLLYCERTIELTFCVSFCLKGKILIRLEFNAIKKCTAACFRF